MFNGNIHLSFLIVCSFCVVDEDSSLKKLHKAVEQNSLQLITLLNRSVIL